MGTKISTISIKSIFHWFLAIGFTVAYISEDFDRNENVHYAFGLFVGALIMFRVIYSFVGPKWASYKMFLTGIKNQTASLVGLFKKETANYISNPIASIVMLSIFVVGVLCSFSGYLLYSIESNSLINLNLSEDFVEEVHTILANLFLILVGIHIVGVIPLLYIY
jgi:cytochrome b